MAISKWFVYTCLNTHTHTHVCYLSEKKEHMLYRHLQHHNDTIIKTQWQRQTQEDFFNKIFTSHIIARVRKGCVGFYCERELETEHKLKYFDPTVMTVTLCLSCSLGLLNRRPRAHSAGCWLYLLHLISIFSGPQTPSGFPRAPSVGCGFPTTSPLQPSGTLLATQLAPLAHRTQLSYIIVRRPLDLWNRMLNRHQAEITVMQFRGHSLPVHHSVVAQWDLHLVPYYQP